jgi:signal transduction histidine kinase
MTTPSQPPPASTPPLSMPQNGTPPPSVSPKSTSPPSAPSQGSSPKRWRLPRHTVRLKLTVLYGGLFLISGTVLLAVTYVFVAHRLPLVATAKSQTTGGGTFNQVFCAKTSAGSSATPAPLGGCATLLNQQRNDELTQLITSSGIALAIMTVVSIGLGWLVAGRVLRPLRTITTAARRISARNLHQRLALDGPDDELTELGKTFNGLLARLEGSFAAQRQFVANASHELRTPLARQRTLVEVALRDPNPTVGSLQAVCERVLATGEEQERLIEALLTLARSQRGLDRREPLDLAAVTGDAVQASEAGAQSRGLVVHSALGEAPALGDPRLAERLVANLVDNAVRHNVPGGWVEVVTGMRAGRGLLSVANTGPVIPPEKVDLLFQPFGRLEASRVSRDGLGLGLSIVTAIAAAHDADLRARPLPGGGLEVEVHFLRAPAGGPAAPATHPKRGSPAGALRPAPKQAWPTRPTAWLPPARGDEAPPGEAVRRLVVPGEVTLALEPAQQHRLAVHLGREVEQQRRDALQLDATRRKPAKQLAQARLEPLGLGQAAEVRQRHTLSQRGLKLHEVGPEGYRLVRALQYLRQQAARLGQAEHAIHGPSLPNRRRNVHPAPAARQPARSRFP